jgi:hypothetical protein
MPRGDSIGIVCGVEGQEAIESEARTSVIVATAEWGFFMVVRGKERGWGSGQRKYPCRLDRVIGGVNLSRRALANNETRGVLY